MTEFDKALDALSVPLKHDDGMPIVPVDYFETLGTVTRAMAPLPVDASRTEKLERIVDRAIDTIDEILSIPIDPYLPDAAKFISIKKDAALGALNFGAKVDENHFRKRSASALVMILEKITAEEKGQAITLVQAAE